MDLTGFVWERLREDETLALYRGRNGDAPSLLLAAPTSLSAESAATERLEHELSLASSLCAEWAARPLALVRHQGRPVLLLDDPGGRPLDGTLGLSADLDRFLTIAIGAAAALGQLHARRLVHKDVRPSNILLDAVGKVTLTGFGFATRAPRERQGPAPPETIAGSLAYMAPEQTGRMNRSVDTRSDLYSLGVSLYELLVGALPFSATEPMEWIHCHIARAPPPPSVRMEGVSPALDAILLKLLAKNAEDRYQTAAGLEHDLARCQRALRSAAPMDAFRLGERDATERLLIPEKLYGRDAEIATLVEASARVGATGDFELALVSGESGVGKSSTVRELRARLSASRALFAMAKFEESKREIPYALLVQAFGPLVRQILSQDDESLARWRAAFASALGSSAKLVVDLLPDLALIIGEPGGPPILSPDEERARFDFILTQFISTFATAQHPLVLFLDDLQWMDPATCDFFERLCIHDEIPHLLLIGAYRSNELSNWPELASAFERIIVARSPTEIRLSSLTLETTTSLVSDSLQIEPAAAAPLAELVHRKTQGNAFFAVQFLTTLELDGLLGFDERARSWQWDLQGIANRAITDNVAELVAARLLRYTGNELDVIKQLACLGNGASVTVLSTALGLAEDAVDAALRDFVAADLVRREERGYAFAHDGVQDAAYALISPDERARMHLRAGRLLSDGLTPKELDDRIFEIVSQFNRGASLLAEPGERTRVAKLNLIAGRRAKTATAYGSAIGYLDAGCALLSDDSWETEYRTTFELELHRADCRFFTGDAERAEESLTVLAARSEGVSDLAAVVGRQMSLYTYQSRIDHALALALACLSQMGTELPGDPTDEEVEQEYLLLVEAIGDRDIADFVDLPEMTDGHWRDAMELLGELLGPAGVLNRNLLDLALIRMANISLEHGNCDASCHAYTNMAARVFGWRFGNVAGAHSFGRLALRLVEERGFDRYASRVYAIISGIVAPWSTPLRESFDIAFRAIDMPRERGGITYAGYAWVCGLTALLDSGKNLRDVERLAQTALASATQSKFLLAVELINTHVCLVRALRDERIDSNNFAGPDVASEAYEAHLASAPHLFHARLRYGIRKLQYLYYIGEFEACLTLVLALEREFGPVPVVGQTPVFEIVEFCLFSGLARAAVLTGGSGEASSQTFASLRENQRQLAHWAEHCPENFADRACLLAAEIERLEGGELEAQRLYEKAGRLAREQGFAQNEALANELAARFYEQRDFPAIAETYLRQAHSAYLRWGAESKARQLERRHPFLLSSASRPAAGAAGGGTNAQLRHLDLAAVVEMYQSLSREIVLERLIERLMITVLETGGAARGVLLLPHGDEMRIVAEAGTDEDAVKVDILPRSHPARGLPQSILNYTVHSREPVILGDATESNPFEADDYLVRARPRSLLCLPLVKQKRLVGVLYLENNLASHIFTPDRLSVLQLLASQAAISIENAELFRDVQETQEQARRVGEDLRRAFDLIPALAWRASADGRFEFANKQWHDFTGIAFAEAADRPWIGFFHRADLEKVAEKWRHLVEFRTSGEFEARMVRHDGEVRRFLVRATPMRDELGAIINWHGTNTDIENLKQAEQAQEALARVSRITAMGELTVSIAHEVNQPLMAIVTNAATCLRWLADDKLDIPEARVAAERIIRHGHRAGDVIASIRALARKASPAPTLLDLSEVVLEVLLLIRNELDRNSITVETDLARGTMVTGDRVQLQQLMLNLMMNGIEAIGASDEKTRLLHIALEHTGDGFAKVGVADTGVGLAAADEQQIFEVFFTTKPDGVGIGLSICRSIVEIHRGRLWASPNRPKGTTFHFTIPLHRENL